MYVKRQEETSPMKLVCKVDAWSSSSMVMCRCDLGENSNLNCARESVSWNRFGVLIVDQTDLKTVYELELQWWKEPR